MMGLEGKIFDFALCEADPIAQCGDFKQALRALKEIRRVLKDDCVLVGSTSERINRVLSEIIKADDLQCLKNVCSVLRGIYQAIENEPNSRMYLFTSNELRKALEEAGFEVLEFSPILIVSQFLPENLKRRKEYLKIMLELERTMRSIPCVLEPARRIQFAARKV
jgi:ubiquinone/menaquinone biosynthesis C-methylase UbiE